MALSIEHYAETVRYVNQFAETLYLLKGSLKAVRKWQYFDAVLFVMINCSYSPPKLISDQTVDDVHAAVFQSEVRGHCRG